MNKQISDDFGDIGRSIKACIVAGFVSAFFTVLGGATLYTLQRAANRLLLPGPNGTPAPDIRQWSTIIARHINIDAFVGLWPPFLFVVLVMGVGITLALCIIGLPGQFVLRRANLNGALYYILPAGAAGTGLLHLIFTASPDGLGGWAFLLFPGFIAGLVYWLIRRPDRHRTKDISAPAS